MARRSVTIQCEEPGCTERAFYEVRTVAEDRELRSKPWRCARHRRPEEVISAANAVRERVLEVYEKPYGKFWRTLGTEESGSGFTHGPGFKAFADDFPAGTRLVVTARLEAS